MVSAFGTGPKHNSIMDHKVLSVHPATDREAFVSLVKSRCGGPYLWGGQGDHHFDCSGLIMWALEQIRIDIVDMTSESMAARWVGLQTTKAHPGCLTFYGSHGRASHVMVVADVWDQHGKMFTLVGARGGGSDTTDLQTAYDKNAMVSVRRGDYWASRYLFMVDIFDAHGRYRG